MQQHQSSQSHQSLRAADQAAAVGNPSRSDGLQSRLHRHPGQQQWRRALLVIHRARQPPVRLHRHRDRWRHQARRHCLSVHRLQEAFQGGKPFQRCAVQFAQLKCPQLLLPRVLMQSPSLTPLPPKPLRRLAQSPPRHRQRLRLREASPSEPSRRSHHVLRQAKPIA